MTNGLEIFCKKNCSKSSTRGKMTDKPTRNPTKNHFFASKKNKKARFGLDKMTFLKNSLDEYSSDTLYLQHCNRKKIILKKNS
jgi:hypothetical protein